MRTGFFLLAALWLSCGKSSTASKDKESTPQAAEISDAAVESSPDAAFVHGRDGDSESQSGPTLVWAECGVDSSTVRRLMTEESKAALENANSLYGPGGVTVKIKGMREVGTLGWLDLEVDCPAGFVGVLSTRPVGPVRKVEFTDSSDKPSPKSLNAIAQSLGIETSQIVHKGHRVGGADGGLPCDLLEEVVTEDSENGESQFWICWRADDYTVVRRFRADAGKQEIVLLQELSGDGVPDFVLGLSDDGNEMFYWVDPTGVSETNMDIHGEMILVRGPAYE